MRKDHTENWKDALSVDFSAESKKREEIKNKLLNSIPKEDILMNQSHKKRFKRSSAIAVAACMALVLSVTAFAAVNYFNLGDYAHYLDTSDEVQPGEVDFPEELQGLLYDENGKLVETIEELDAPIYNADGDAVMLTNDEAGNMQVVTMKEMREEFAEKSTLFETLEDAGSYLYFQPRTFEYVPEGYELEGYRIYNDDNGELVQDSKYLEMNYYKDNDLAKYIFVQARFMDEDTEFTSGLTENSKTTSINGYEAMIQENTIDILIDDVLYFISGSDLPAEELMKMAEDLTK